MQPHSTMLALFGSLGTPELLVIALVMLLLFGSRLPEVMRSMGRGVVEFKKGLKDTQEEVERSTDSPDGATKSTGTTQSSASAPREP